MSEKFPKKTESSGRKPWFSDRSFYEYVGEIAMKNISIKGILLSIFIILESGYYFLNPDGSYTYFGRTNWVDEAYNDVGFSTIHNIDISGKTDRISYYFSGGYILQNGMF